MIEEISSNRPVFDSLFRRRGSLGLWLACLLLIVAGCQSDESGEEEAIDLEPAGQPGALVLGTGFDDTWGPVELQLVEAFEASNANITLTRDPLDQSWEENLTQSPVPDILFGGSDVSFTNAVGVGDLLNLDNVWRQLDLDSSVPAAIQATSQSNNGQYMVPMTINWVAIYYNVAIFEAEGLSAPETWGDLLNLCAALSAIGETALGSGPPAWTGRLWFDMINVRLNGAEFHREVQQGLIPYDDPRIRNVIEHWAELIEAGCFGEFNTTISVERSRTAIVRDEEGLLDRNKAVMTLTNSWEMGTLPPIFQEQVAFFSFPIIDESVPRAEMVWTLGYGVPEDSANLVSAISFITFAGSVETQELIGPLLGSFSIPAHGGVPIDSLLPAQQDAMEMLQNSEDGVKHIFWSGGFVNFGQTDYAFGNFLRNSDEIDELLEALEEMREAPAEDE